MTAQYQVHGDVAVITMDNPPMNALALSVREGIVRALADARTDPEIKAVVLTGAHRAFSSGADIKEFGSEKAFEAPDLPAVIAIIEKYSKPVIAALHSVAMGGGLELALACHYRIVVRDCNVALSEVKFGLIPGAGGTQRLPRLIGVEPALNMIVSGAPMKSEQLMQIPDQHLFDKLVESQHSLLDEAIVLARHAATAHAAGAPLPQVRNLACAHPQGSAYFQFARNMLEPTSKHFPAARECVDAVEAATRMAFDAGIAHERSAFFKLLDSSQSKALRHAFVAERAASKVSGTTSATSQREIRSVAVIGAGTMGGGISMNFLNAGIAVTLLETRAEALERGIAGIRKNYETQVNKGKLTAQKCEERMALLNFTLDYAGIAQADLVIEAVFEDIGVKESVFRQLDAVMKPGAILATNTSTLDLNQIAAFTGRPADVVGMHFFSPANIMKLLEIVRGAQTSTETLATVMALGKKIRKTCVVAGVCDGFIGNRMLEQYLRQAGFLLDEGCTPLQVDRAIEQFGFAMGPFRMSDLAGNDIGWSIRKRHAVERPGLRFSKTADLLCEMGRLGQKTGAGWYDYVQGNREPLASCEVLAMIDANRTAQCIAARAISNQEIVERLVYALVNEAARIVEEGIASRAGDIDIVFLTGYGFPLWRGGPLHYADQVGLYNVTGRMKQFSMNPLDDGAFWQPAGLLEQLVAEGRTFTG
ncbi:3-hydroxyacyl-CoA dehydrogenase NAD-binding domain-containing protein [Janthinobacterium sp. HLX7-2]|uniref:3-hydroxyacyl-CoA dehydrogenase NAD-binding domain-containing protein n=1 Tax=Janthinobacterium sp. HLX7-2 TaxID=1259331 RepID=UPI003F22D40C